MHLSNTNKLIAIVIGSLGRGGTERICIDILKCLVHANYGVDLVLFKLKGELLAQIPRGVNVHVVGKKNDTPDTSNECLIQHVNVNWVCPRLKDKISYSDFFSYVVVNWPFSLLKKFPHRRSHLVRNAYGFAMYLTQSKPACVFAMKTREIFTALIGREISGTGNPIIWSAHGPITPILRSQLKNFRMLLQKANWAHLVSSRLKDEFREQGIFPANRVSVIHNFIDSQRVLHLASLSSDHPWFDRKKELGHKIILSVGRLENQKNFSLLIRSFSQLSNLRDTKLVILGEGSLRNSLQLLVNDLELTSRVSMPGWTDNPYAFMSRADVFVLSSIWEGFGIVFIEALSCGCKVISTDCPTGPREVLGHGRFGTLVPVNDEQAMSNAISDALEEVDYDRELLVNRALEFSPEKFLVQFEQMIGKVIDW